MKMDRFVGIDIGCTKMLMLAEYQGEKITKTVPTGFAVTREHLKNEIVSFIQGLPFTPSGMGVAVVGFVENENKVVFSSLSSLTGITTSDLRVGDFPVYFINDVKAATLHETSSIDPNTTSVVIVIGTGIAMGIRANGQFVNGANGWSGELGYIPIPTPEGTNRLAKLAGGIGVLEMAGTDAEDLQQRLEQGNQEAQEVILTAGKYMGIGLAIVINLLNPEKIVLGGGTLKYKGYYKAALEHAQQHALPDLWNACTIEQSKEPGFMVAQGARRFAFRS